MGSDCRDRLRHGEGVHNPLGIWEGSLKGHGLGERGSDSEEAGVSRRSVTLVSGSVMEWGYMSICALGKCSASELPWSQRKYTNPNMSP